MEKIVKISQLVKGLIDEQNFYNLFSDRLNDPKALKLFDGIMNGRYKSDSEAALDIYKSDASNKNYLMLKSRVRGRLLNLVFTIDISKRIKSAYGKAQYKCYRNLFSAQQLIKLGYRDIAVDIIKDSYPLILRFQFNDLRLLAMRMLMDHEGFTGNKKKILFYSQQLLEAGETLSNEIKLESLYQLIRIEMRGQTGFSVQVRSRIKETFFKLSEEFKAIKNPTHEMQNYFFGATTFFHHLNNDHQKALEALNQWEKYLTKHKSLINQVSFADVYVNKLDTSLYLRDYETGRASAEACEKFFKKGTLNWLIFRENYFLLCMHTGKYDIAKSVYQEVISDLAFMRYASERSERWKIFGAFLFFVLPVDNRHRRFNIAKFVNEVPIYARDKAGYNISILIAQISLHIKNGEFDKAMDKVSSLKSYEQRHIKKNVNPRTYYFIRMLKTLVRYDFEPEKSEEIASKFLDKLKHSHVGDKGRIETLEVVPYDLLWNEIINKIRAYKYPG